MRRRHFKLYFRLRYPKKFLSFDSQIISNLLSFNHGSLVPYFDNPLRKYLVTSSPEAILHACAYK